MKRVDLERHLRGGRAACFIARVAVTPSWLNPSLRKIGSVPRHREIKDGAVLAICKQLEFGILNRR